jgi:hypothetical protein
MAVLGIYTNTASNNPDYDTFGHKKVIFKMLDSFKIAVPTHRTAQCLSHAVQTKKVEIRKGKSGARYNNLCTCGRVWTCPYCASRTSNHRRMEIAYAVGKWLKSDAINKVALLTYTIQHDASMSLPDCLNVLSNAYRSLHSGSFWQKQKKEHGLIGSIRTLEITWGINGFHTHIHELLFHTSDQEPTLSEAVGSQWTYLTHKVGNMTNEHGFDLEVANEKVYQYVAKHGHLPLAEWSLAHEVTNPHKRAGKENRTYMQVLFDMAHGKGRPLDKRFIVGYCNALHGRKQLVWSPGLKQIFGLKEIADEVIAQLSQSHESDELFAIVSEHAWQLIKSKFKRGEVLVKASELNFEQFQLWLRNEVTGIDTVHINTVTETETVWGGGVAPA